MDHEQDQRVCQVDIFEQVEKNIDKLVINNAYWTASASKDILNSAEIRTKYLLVFGDFVWLLMISSNYIEEYGLDACVVAVA